MKRVAQVAAVTALLACGAGAWLWYTLARPYQGFASEGVFVDVPRGASSRGVSRLLKEDGVVRSAIAFELYARRHPKRRLQAGEYFFNRPVNAREVFWQIAGGGVYEVAFTVREGETIFDIAHDLEAGKFMSAEDFLTAAQDPTAIRDIAPQAKTLEGFLFPATYYLPRHPAPNELTEEMVKKFKEKWAEIAPANKREGVPGERGRRAVASVVTLASLVERETPKPQERPLVAGVFENRLAKHMPLQCDPTVIYGQQELGLYNGRLTGADLHFDSLYNTYTHAGLPPGPIGNPGEASLRAALDPAHTDDLYFVANTQGGHFFSATLKEHNQNVMRYRRLLAGEPADPPPAPAPAAPTAATRKHHGKKSQPKHHGSAAR